LAPRRAFSEDTAVNFAANMFRRADA
jgi:hypothetical protein